jgi:hypothetical protein
VKRWYYIVLAGLVLAGVYVYLHRQELGLTGSHGLLSSDAPSADLASSPSRLPLMNWQTIDRSGDGFKVEMPGDIREIQIPAYNEHGGAEQVDLIYATPSAEITYSAAWADNPPVSRANSQVSDRVLDMARDDSLARTQTSLISESKSSPGGYPTRNFSARNAGGGVMDVRLTYAGHRLYMLIAAFPATSSRREQDVTRFFNSFKLVSNSRIPETMPSAPAPDGR